MKKLKRIEEVNYDLHENLPLAVLNVYNPPLTSNRKRQTAVCGK